MHSYVRKTSALLLKALFGSLLLAILFSKISRADHRPSETPSQKAVPSKFSEGVMAIGGLLSGTGQQLKRALEVALIFNEDPCGFTREPLEDLMKSTSGGSIKGIADEVTNFGGAIATAACKIASGKRCRTLSDVTGQTVSDLRLVAASLETECRLSGQGSDTQFKENPERVKLFEKINKELEDHLLGARKTLEEVCRTKEDAGFPAENGSVIWVGKSQICEFLDWRHKADQLFVFLKAKAEGIKEVKLDFQKESCECPKPEEPKPYERPVASGPGSNPHPAAGGSSSDPSSVPLITQPTGDKPFAGRSWLPTAPNQPPAPSSNPSGLNYPPELGNFDEALGTFVPPTVAPTPPNGTGSSTPPSSSSSSPSTPSAAQTLWNNLNRGGGVISDTPTPWAFEQPLEPPAQVPPPTAAQQPVTPPANISPVEPETPPQDSPREESSSTGSNNISSSPKPEIPGSGAITPSPQSSQASPRVPAGNSAGAATNSSANERNETVLNELPAADGSHTETSGLVAGLSAGITAAASLAGSVLPGVFSPLIAATGLLDKPANSTHPVGDETSHPGGDAHPGAASKEYDLDGNLVTGNKDKTEGASESLTDKAKNLLRKVGNAIATGVVNLRRGAKGYVDSLASGVAGLWGGAGSETTTPSSSLVTSDTGSFSSSLSSPTSSSVGERVDSYQKTFDDGSVLTPEFMRLQEEVRSIGEVAQNEISQEPAPVVEQEKSGGPESESLAEWTKAAVKEAGAALADITKRAGGSLMSFFKKAEEQANSESREPASDEEKKEKAKKVFVDGQNPKSATLENQPWWSFITDFFKSRK